MIYDNLKKATPIFDIAQVAEDVKHYQSFFKVQPNDVVVDIGAHVGMFIRDLLGTASKIVAVEPDPLFINELNKIEFPALQTVCAGVAATTGKSLIKSDGSANVIGSGDVEIDTISFKDLVSKANLERIDFLKIDCEGGEYDILTEEYFSWIKNHVKYIAGEFHLHSDAHKQAVVKILDLFEQYEMKYKLTSIDRVILSKEHFLANLNYYNEINFFVVVDGEFPKQQLDVKINYVNGCRVDITNIDAGEYTLRMIDNRNDAIVYSTNINVHEGEEQFTYWSKSNVEYFVPWRVEISKGNDIIFTNTLNLENQRVLINIDSKSLGDTIAWFPYVEEFRKKHKCTVLVGCWNSQLFEKTYPKITFIPLGDVVSNIVAQYNIGWYYNDKVINLNRQPFDPKSQPMQKTAADILGLEYSELCPTLNFVPSKRPIISKKYACIGGWSTAQAKFWNNPEGWQSVVDYLIDNNYVVVWLSSEGAEYMGNKAPERVIFPEEYTLQSTMNYLYHCDFFIGIGSGLTWLAWAMKKDTVLISGFSEDYTEMTQDIVRINAPESSCRGCFNVHKLDPNDWNWCPELKGTKRQHECTKTITADSVISKIKPLVK